MTEIGRNTSHHRLELPDGGEVELAWGVATHTGHRRRHNEDSFVASPPLFAVADGMGGHSAGDLASAAVVRRLAEATADIVGAPSEIGAALHLATQDIAEVSDEASLGVGTTVTGAMLTIEEGEASWLVFNVGDSRVYVVDAGVLAQVTVDHSVVQEMVDAGMISASEAEAHPDSNIITRAVGFNADPVPDFWHIPLRTGMRLLLCSDGLTKEVDLETIEGVLTAGSAAAVVVDELVERALQAGGRDNVTAVVVDVLSAPGGDGEATGPRGDDDAADEEDTLPPTGELPAPGSDREE
ncbi:protein phosphatase 2C domain-containing protein [Salinibacterium sp. SYSU T00001]|uniref:PP2C family protein-serine/threonine phosphatase n=1 Tax=Homoserinimonas sedimenticola TaxID=2986805 RepID=UPI002236A01D|nr:protein phosphatase 2C domain-containing protein [Salinibacterium sedimenticola]MCW4386685.1 protein phosphatase 2C domain-containing protein [Salinibacterium sedimenticola]